MLTIAETEFGLSPNPRRSASLHFCFSFKSIRGNNVDEFMTALERYVQEAASKNIAPHVRQPPTAVRKQ